MSRNVIEQLQDEIEEEYKGYTIHVANNADKYRGGFEWCVISEEGIEESDLSFDIDDALNSAKKWIDENPS